MNKELLIKYFNNRCSDEELGIVLTWLEESAGTPEGKAFLYSIYEEVPTEEGILNIDFDLILNKIHHKVNLSKSMDLLKIAQNYTVRHKRRDFFIKILTRAAAFLLIPVLGYSVYMTILQQTVKHDQTHYKIAYYEVTSSSDAITKVTLPDSSKVWLNHKSTLKYPAIFEGDTRVVELTGEGYFEVAHNSSIPFIVETGAIQVLARGTTFNISAYPDDDRINTSLVNGKVELSRVKKDGEVIALLTMKPNDLVVYKKTDSEVTTYTINDDRNYSWKDGKLRFVKEPMTEVTKKLSRWFDADFQIMDTKLYDLTYSATFDHETLPEVMHLLTMVSPVSYAISDRKKMADGTFTRRKVTLHYKQK